MSDLTEKLPADEWCALLMGEALLFGLLGRVLYANPTRTWLEPLIQDNLFDSVPFADRQDAMQQGLALLGQWTATVGARLTDEDVIDLRADYAHLFVGDTPMRVPPWESVYFSEERLTFQQETLDVHRWFEQLGLRINTDNRDPDDHIAFELSFIAQCAERAFHACEDHDSATLDDLVATQRTFLETHLLRWGFKWAELMQVYARTDFYRGLALMVQGGLQELAQTLDVNIPQNVKYPGLSITDR